MTSQQLIEARAALWHHNANPILTLEEAASWVATTGFLLFIPRRQQLRAPSPTFVEATMGRLEHTPGRPDIENALSLSNRLFDSGEVLPLNLLGTLSEEPDFLIARDRLPWLFSLRGDRSWKSAPGGRTSPLNISVWKLLDEQGELTAAQIQSGIGREVTETSVRRALIDLWGTLRVFPRYHQGEETTWTLTKDYCPKECTKSVTTAQGAALSLFLADYLRSAIAATEDDVAAFLSPLASRSRLREVLHALTATRQLSTIPLGPNSLYFVTGELPEFPEIAAPEPSEASAAAGEDGHSNSEDASSESGERIHKYTPRTASREPYQRSGSRTGDRSERPQREGRFQPRREGGFKPPYRKPRTESEFSSESAEAGRSEREPRPYSEERPRPPFRKSYAEGSERKSFGDRKPYGRSSEGSSERKPYGDRPERKSFGERKPFGDRKPYGRSSEGSSDRKPYGDRPAFRKDRDADDRPRRDAESSERPPRKTYGKPGGFSKPGPKAGARPGAKSFSRGPAKKFGKPTGSGPKKSYGKPGGKSGFSKGPSKGFSKGPKRGPGKPRRSE